MRVHKTKSVARVVKIAVTFDICCDAGMGAVSVEVVIGKEEGERSSSGDCDFVKEGFLYVGCLVVCLWRPTSEWL